MIESIEFTNFKSLRQTTLPLAPFTLLLGPNGSGKSTVLQALQAIATFAASQFRMPRQGNGQFQVNWATAFSVIASTTSDSIQVVLRLHLKGEVTLARFSWFPSRPPVVQFFTEDRMRIQDGDAQAQLEWLVEIQPFALDPVAIAQPNMVNSGPLQSNGAGLAAVLDSLKDDYPERWAALLEELRSWLPEYDSILFDRPEQGMKGIVLRTLKGGHRIPAAQLSHGTLVALALLTLAYSPNPPSVIGLDEIDRGIHPRLLRHLQDALYRLSYPESCGETRPPIQVIATTHSPYLLDLYRERPEEIVLAQKDGLEVTMQRLSDIAHYEEILGDAPLSEVWYSGVLGGVSVNP